MPLYKVNMILKFLLFEFLVSYSTAFPPNSESASNVNTWTHESITKEGIFRSVALFLKENGMVDNNALTDISTIEAFFGSDADSLETFYTALETICKGNNFYQLDTKRFARVHVNAEEIGNANILVQQCRLSLIQNTNDGIYDVAQIRDKLGQCLYTIQAFYSSTNWVNVDGTSERYFYEFGLEDDLNKALAKYGIQLSDSSDLPCTNADYSASQVAAQSCRDNVLNNVLTSGYRSGQDMIKPTSSNPTYGKCSHGGFNDDSRTLTATCGINKETSDPIYSPHFMFHEKAAYRAIDATQSYLTQNETGLLSAIGKEMFRDVFALRTKANAITTSLAFVIDVSGSMRDDINAVKEVTIQLVSTTTGSTNEVADYVLTVFNDPENLTSTEVMEDGEMMIDKLSNLVASGGGDCPEYALSGILQAITYARRGSTLFVFTDADAKDEDKLYDVIEAATVKDITITFLLTGKCGARRKRESNTPFHHGIKQTRQRYPRNVKLNAYSIFDQIANGTGGDVHETIKEDLPIIIDEVIEESFPSALAILDIFNFQVSDPSTRRFYVDDSISLVRIEVVGTHQRDAVSLNLPNGTTTGDTIVLEDRANNKLLLSIETPVAGSWSVNRNSPFVTKINITGQTPVDFNFKFTEQHSDGNFYDTSGTPVAGQSYGLVSTVFGLQDSANVVSVELMDMQGNITTTLPLTSIGTGINRRYKVDLNMPAHAFIIKIIGTDKSGNTFTRMSSTEVLPVSAKLDLQRIYEDLPYTQTRNVSYEISNYGSTGLMFEANIMINGINEVPSRLYNIESGGSVEDLFQIQGSKDISIITYTVTVTLNGSNEVLQTRTERVKVSPVENVVCSIVSKTGNCPLEAMNTRDCKSYKWSAYTSLTFGGVSLTTLSLSNAGEGVTVLYDGNSFAASPVFANISGDCCSPSIYLNAVDSEKYLGRCDIDYSNGMHVQPIISDTEKTSEEETLKTDYLIMAVGIGTGLGAVVIIIIGLVIYAKFYSKHGKVDVKKKEYAMKNLGTERH